jgi:hypothetical protein
VLRNGALRLVHGALVAVLAGLVGCTPPSYWGTHAGQGVLLSRDAYAQALIARARARRFAYANAWLRLGHYRRDPLGGAYESEADGPSFFLSNRGKRSPEAELEAMIRALLVPVSAGDDHTLDAHPACRFPARVLVLERELGLDLSRLGAPRCPGFSSFLSELRPGGVMLVFTSYYLNNPASAFGHTFLRIRKAEGFALGKKRELLDYGVDFSANVTTSNPVAYAIMGLTGMFEGTFKRVPYYYKVREYNDVESRDLWEYELAFDAHQLQVLAGHLWEVGQTTFDYYYLSENCSYHVLGLIEAARPELTLSSAMSSPVVPAATVQALFQHEGLVRGVRYRPAMRSQLEARLEALSPDEQDRVAALMADTEASLGGLGPERAIAVLDAATDLIDVRYARELLFERAGEGATRKQRLLERRASLRLASPDLEVEGERDKAPEHGHAPRRAGLSAGIDTGQNLFVGADFRLALHDLADPAGGYPDLSQIEFLPVRARFGLVSERFRVRLDEAALVRVISLSSFERFDRHISFQLAVGARSIDGGLCARCTAGNLLIGGGLARAFVRDAIALFVLGDLEVLLGPWFRRGTRVPVQAGVGPSGGLRLRLHPRLILLAKGRWYALPYQDPSSRFQADAVLRFQVFRAVALSAEGRAIREGVEGQAFVLGYF